MARVKTFYINVKTGLPDKAVEEFVTGCEREMGFIRVTTTLIPFISKNDLRDLDPSLLGLGVQHFDARLTIIVTKADDLDKN